MQLFEDGDKTFVVDEFFFVGEFFTGTDFFEDVVKAGEREAKCVKPELRNWKKVALREGLWA